MGNSYSSSERKKLNHLSQTIGSNDLIVETIVGFLPFSYIPKLRLVNRTWREACQKQFALKAILKLKTPFDFQLLRMKENGEVSKIPKILSLPLDISFRRLASLSILFEPIESCGETNLTQLQLLCKIGPRIEALECESSVVSIPQVLGTIHEYFGNLTSLILNLHIYMDYDSGRSIRQRASQFLELELQEIPQLQQIKFLQIGFFPNSCYSHDYFSSIEELYHKMPEILLKSCVSLEVLSIHNSNRDFLEACYQLLHEKSSNPSNPSNTNILIDFPHPLPFYLDVAALVRYSPLRFQKLAVLVRQRCEHSTEIDELNSLAILLERQKHNLIHFHLIDNRLFYTDNLAFKNVHKFNTCETFSTLELPELRILRVSFCGTDPGTVCGKISHVISSLKLNWNERFPKLFAFLFETLYEEDLTQVFSHFGNDDVPGEFPMIPLKSVKVLGFPLQFVRTDLPVTLRKFKYYSKFQEMIPMIDILFPNLIWFVDLKCQLQRNYNDDVYYWCDIKRKPRLKNLKHLWVEDRSFISNFTDCLKVNRLSDENY